MIPRKLVETAFRRAWLLALPVLLVPALVIAFRPHTTTYASSATVWVAKIEGVPQAARAATNNSTATSTSEEQVQVLSDLLQTSAFRETVAVAAGLVAADAPDTARRAAGDTIAASVTVTALGPNLLGIRAHGSAPGPAQQIAGAVITAYQARVLDEGAKEAQTVVSYFEKQAALAQDDLAKAQAELASYLKAQPPAAADKPIVDTGYQALQAKVDSQAKVADRLLGSLQDARLTAASGATASATTFTVQDAPLVPSSPVPEAAAKRLGYPLAGVLLGVFIAAGYLYVSFRTDHTIRSSEDLVGAGVQVVGTVPELRPRGLLARHGGARRNFARRVAVAIPPAPETRGGGS